MKLYYSRGACSLAPHIALYETGLPFTVARTDTKTKLLEDGSDFRAISPNGYVPVLELDSGERLTEAGVVLQYIADQKPASGLIPAFGTLQRYRVMEWLTFISSEVHKGYSPLFKPTTPEDYKPVVKAQLAQRLGYVNEQLAGKQFLLGDQFTVADAYLFVVVNWSRAVGVDLSPFPNLQQFQERVAKRPATQSALKAEGLVK